jgi:hypothetical protein
MFSGSKHIVKPQKSKFKKDQDKETFKQFRKKHQDKATYRLIRKEEQENVNERYSEEN